MQRLSLYEKKLSLAGAGRKAKAFPSKSSYSRKMSNYNSRIHNVSLLSLAIIPGVVSLGEGIYNFWADSKFWRDKSMRFDNLGNKNFYGYHDGGISSKRDYYAYASESFRPMIRFSPYYYKSGITFGLPWFK